MPTEKVIRRKRRKPLQKQLVVANTIDDRHSQDRRGRPRTTDRQERGQKPFFGHFDKPVYDVLTRTAERWHTSMISVLTRLLCEEEQRHLHAMNLQRTLEPVRQVEIAEVLERKPTP